MTNIGDVRDVIRGAIASVFGFGGRLIARAGLMIFAGHMYGMKLVGVLALLAAISEMTASVSVMGLKRSLLDMLSERAEKGERAEPRIINAICVALLISATILALGYAIVTLLSHKIPEMVTDIKTLIPYFLIAVPAYVFSDVTLTAIKFKRIIKWDVWARAIAEPWMFLVLTVAFYYAGFKETGLLMAYAGSVLTAALCASAGLVHTYGAAPLAKAGLSPRMWPSILKQSAPVGVTDAGVMALRRIDLAVLFFIAGPQASGLYYMVQQLATIPQKVQGLFEPMMSPVIARLHNRKNGDGIRSNLIAVCRWIFIIQLGLTIPMVIFGKELLGLFGDEFMIGTLVLLIILVAELIDGTFLTVETALIFARPNIPPVLLVLALIIEVCVIAVCAQKWGATGAAIGFMSSLLFLAVARIAMLRKHLGFGVLTTGYIWPVLIGGGIAALLLFARQYLQPVHGAWTAGAIAIALLGYGFLIKTFALTKADDQMFAALKKNRAEPST